MKLNRIKLVLVEKGISQTQLAKDLGKSFSSVNAYCSNRNTTVVGCSETNRRHSLS